MSVNIIRSQQKAQGGFNCNTVGYLNPVWYTFQQYSHTFTSVTGEPIGAIRLYMPSTVGIAIGDKIRYAGGPYDGVKTGTVVALSANVYIDVDNSIFLGTASGTLTNLSALRNLGVETELYDWLTNYTISKATSFWQTRPNLIGTIDIQSELRSLYYAARESGIILSPISFVKHVSAGRFKLRFRESWLDSANVVQKTAWADINEDGLAISARKALKESNGNNMIDYVLKSLVLTNDLPIFANPGFDGGLQPWVNGQIESDELAWGWSGDKAFLQLPINSVSDPHFKDQPNNWTQRGYGFINPQFLDINGSDEGSSPTAGYGWTQPVGGGTLPWQFTFTNGATPQGSWLANALTYRLGQSNAEAAPGATINFSLRHVSGAGEGDVTAFIYDTAGNLKGQQTVYIFEFDSVNFNVPVAAGSSGVFIQLRNDGSGGRGIALINPGFITTQPQWSGAVPAATISGVVSGINNYANFLYNRVGTADSQAIYKKMKIRVQYDNTGTINATLEVYIAIFNTRYDELTSLPLKILDQSVAPGAGVLEGVVDFTQAVTGRLGVRVGVYAGDAPVVVAVDFFGEVEDMQVLYQPLTLPAGSRTIDITIAPSVKQFRFDVVAFDTLPAPMEVLATVSEFRSAPEEFNYSLPLTIVTPRSNLGLRFQNVEGDNIAVDSVQINSVSLGAPIAPGKFHTRFDEPRVFQGPLPDTEWEFTSISDISASPNFIYRIFVDAIPAGFNTDQPVRIVGGQFDDPGYISYIDPGGTFFDVREIFPGKGDYLNSGKIYNFALQPSPARRPVTFSLDKSSEAAVVGASMRVTYLDINRNSITAHQGAPYMMTFPASLGAGVYSFIVEPGLFPVGTAYIQIFASRNFATGDYLSEIKTLRVVGGCTPFVLVEWENSLGGFEQWLFERRIFTRRGSDTPPAVTERYDPDIENSEGNLYRDESSTQMSLIMADEFVPFEDVPWLDEVKRSKTVRLTFENGVRVFVVPTSDSTTYDSRTRYTNFGLTLRLPAGFNPRLVDSSI